VGVVATIPAASLQPSSLPVHHAPRALELTVRFLEAQDVPAQRLFRIGASAA
jgi:hypothetical protein